MYFYHLKSIRGLTISSSLSFAVAGYFKLKIYIVSLNSPAMGEENLGTLFGELPNQCVVLLEDIDTAGLTHTRDDKMEDIKAPKTDAPATPSATNVVSPVAESNKGRLSLSALLNIIDGVAATEGRILIMTTNHLDKLDKALIRPGRVDMTVKFDLASTPMIATIFRSIFATLEGDAPKSTNSTVVIRSPKKASSIELSKAKALEEERKTKLLEAERVAEEARIHALGTRFAEIIPAMTFSPAEIQGYLLRYKRNPEAAIANAAEWVTDTKVEKVKQRETERREEEERLAKEAKEAKEKAEKEAEERRIEDKEKAIKAEEEKPKVNGVKAEAV